MKNSTRKLFLSICTLAICAVTLVSTTFAWYTSNTEVTSNTLSASASTDTGSTLMVSQYDKATGDWSGYKNSITFDTTGASLLPVHFNPRTKEYSYLTTGTPVAGTQYLEFILKFKTTATTTSDIEVFFKTFNLSATGRKGFDNLIPASTNSGLSGDTYMIDMLKATDMVIMSKTPTVAETVTVYQLDNYAAASQGVITTQDGETTVEHPNAIGYYNEVMPNDLPATPNYTPNGTDTHKLEVLAKEEKDMHSLFTIPYVQPVTNAEGEITSPGYYQEVEVKIQFYLNGWDAYCYDACKGQTFTLNVVFSTEQPTA